MCEKQTELEKITNYSLDNDIYNFWIKNDLEKTMEYNYKLAINYAESSLKWYKKNKLYKMLPAKIVRTLTIVLISFGLICPLLKPLDTVSGFRHISQTNLFGYGYFCLAIAAFFLSLDKYYGFSSGWIRYVQTQMELEKLIKVFNQKWAISLIKNIPDSISNDEAIYSFQLINEFINQVADTVRKETEIWAVEFQDNMAKLQVLAKTDSDLSKLGAIKVNINIKDSSIIYDFISIKLDGIEKTKAEGNVGILKGITPGVHQITVIGIKENQQIKLSSGAVDLKAGAFDVINIDL